MLVVTAKQKQKNMIQWKWICENLIQLACDYDKK